MNHLKKVAFTIALFFSVLIQTSFVPRASATIYFSETISSVARIDVLDAEGNYQWGTGFFISADGLILTNAHVIWDYTTDAPAEYIDLCVIDDEFSDPNCAFSGRVLAYDTTFDLAILYPAYLIDENGEEYGDFLTADEILSWNIPYVDFADDLPELGDELKVLGFPAASGNTSISLTSGAVTGFYSLAEDFIGYILVDATINPGNSGGPVYNADERVIGVASQVTTGGVGGNYGVVTSNDVILYWFLQLVDQGVLNEDYVIDVFSNDAITTSVEDLIPFTDVNEDHPYYDAITYLKLNGIVGGYDDGSYRPENPMNRAEFVKILIEAFYGTPDAIVYTDCFWDIPAGEWYEKYACKAKSEGIIDGYPDGSFGGNIYINTAEAFKILLNMGDFAIYSPSSDPFNDVPADEWYAPYAYTAQSLGFVSGSTFGPGDDMTRGRFADHVYFLFTNFLVGQ